MSSPAAAEDPARVAPENAPPPPKLLKDFSGFWTAAELLASKQHAAGTSEPKYNRVITVLYKYHSTPEKTDKIGWSVPCKHIYADNPERPEFDQLHMVKVAAAKTARLFNVPCTVDNYMHNYLAGEQRRESVNGATLAVEVVIPIHIEHKPDMECDTMMAAQRERKWIGPMEQYYMTKEEFAPQMLKKWLNRSFGGV
ncbi:hypothetical protein LTR85_005005 [Meristemomyces frigidus]|nr:hypothetical protein LTR85_005005 [Meristemomyces frigidus]